MQWSLRLSESKVGMHFKGPIIGLFLGTCGCRKTTIIGGLLTALGWVISAYATNVYYLFISFGLTAGIGSGMACLPAIVMVGQYFKKRRALAQGLSTTGTGFGTFIMTLLLKYLCTEYSWRNAMLIHGAVNLNLCVCGALMRPPPSSSSVQIENQSQPECAETLQKEIPNSDQVAHAIDIDGIEEHETSKEEETKSLSLEEVSELQEAENKDRDIREVIF